MAISVFGTRVTDATLKAMPEYEDKCSISQQERAKVALEQVYTEDKAIAARSLLEKLQGRCAESELVSTMSLIYNATGATMTFENFHSFKGRLCESAYPMIIANGQWGVFFHDNLYHSGGDKISKGGVVYSALNNQGIKKHFFIGFSNNGNGYNRVYSEIRNIGEVEWHKVESWKAYGDFIDKGTLMLTRNISGGYLTVSIGNAAVSVCEAIMTLPEAI